MSISSVDEATATTQFGHAQSLAPKSGVQRSASSAQSRPSIAGPAHVRSTSLGGSILSNIRGQQPHAKEDDELSQPPSPPTKSTSPQPSSEAPGNPTSLAKALPQPPSSANASSSALDMETRVTSPPVFLIPHILSPTPDEFLLVTGTHPLEPGIGMFVNLDGDPTRPTIQFEHYPKQVVSYGTVADLGSSRSTLSEEDNGFILASLARRSESRVHHGIEIQGWDAGGDVNSQKFWLEAPEADASVAYGIRSLIGEEEIHLQDIVDKLCQQRFTPFPSPIEISSVSLKSSDSRTALSMERVDKEKELFEREGDSSSEASLPEGWDVQRNLEEEQFTRRLAMARAKLAVWTGDCIWWALRNPLIIQLDSILDTTRLSNASQPGPIDKTAVFGVLATIRGREPKTELEFMSLGYLRQKAGVLLLTSLLLAADNDEFSDRELDILEEVLVESKLDPRVVLSLVPKIRNEIIEGRRGIWVPGGVKKIAEAYLRSNEFLERAMHPISSLSPRTIHFFRKFLFSWRKMKGFGSIADEHEVFRAVDAALLMVLLDLDQSSQGGPIRVELNQVVDRGVECFDRAVDLLESYHRLFVLSRLYQSRKMRAEVLATWRRIIEGEEDRGDEQPPDEERVRDYLTKTSNRELVKEYGLWLANRNPKLGVQVFAEDKGKAPKFEPAEAVKMLKEESPNAVKYYLEHLVFGKGHSAYVNDLIHYYLDVLVTDLQSSQESREIVKSTYDAYRALEAPKPTYRHFLTDNAPPDDEVWQSRLRLLQLLGGGHDYDSSIIRDRIASLPEEELLVPETIILAGKARQHQDALRLLVHKLGDYDTAISYCLRGGSSIYAARPGRSEESMPPSMAEQRRLFHAVFGEFLTLEDVSNRVHQTGALLEHFGGWFEIDDVLAMIPDSWSVGIVAGFLAGSLRRIVRDRNEVLLRTALHRAQNLQVSYELVTKRDEKGPSIEASN